MNDEPQYQDKYFAADSADKLAGHLSELFVGWHNEVNTNSLKKKWLKSYYLYYGRHWRTNVNFDDSEILKLGDEGELSAITINHYRNLIKHILVLTTNQKPAFDVRAINSDHESLQQAKLANNILEAYLKEKRLRRYVRTAAEHALVFGKGFLKITWEPSLGEPVAAESYVDNEGQPKERLVYEGDVDTMNPSVFDVYVDQTQEDWIRCEYQLCRSYRNKFSLAVRYPQLKEKILALPTKNQLDGERVVTLQRIDETADVPVYEFFHKRTDALPNGRYLLFCSSDVVLYDGPLPYKRLPIFRITPGEIFGTTEGYSDAFDLMGMQQAINVLASTIFSNESTFGVQSVLVPEGANLTHTQLAKGMAALQYNPAAGEPKPLQLTSTPQEVFKFLEMMERMMETISGVNSVARGNPEHSLKSGVALGLVQSMAVQFASAFQESYAELLEDAGTFIIELLQAFANTKRMVAMAGRWSKGTIQSFTAEDLSNVSRVTVELGNPMARTTAGRIAIADNLLERGLVTTPQEYTTVMQTGQLDPLLRSDEAEVQLIHQENDKLADGVSCPVLIFDKHLLHIKEHKTLLDDPFVRENSKVLPIVMAHIQEHMNQYQMQPPIITMITGEPPPPPPGMMMGPMGEGMGPGPVAPGSAPLGEAFPAPNSASAPAGKGGPVVPTQFGS
jgi:hypothetical protein